MKVAGFEFESEEMAASAEKELQAVNYVKSQTKMDDPGVVLKVYTALVNQKSFSTPVGLSFLEDLQEYLYGIPYIDKADIPLIPITDYMGKKDKEKAKEKTKPEPQGTAVDKSQPVKESGKYKTLFHVSLFFAIVFLIIIGGMFTITYLSGNNVNIINYENEIIDKYEAWEQELQDREDELKKRESELNED